MTEPPQKTESERLLEKQNRRLVELVASVLVPLDKIALLVDPPTTVERLKADYAEELETGPAKSALEVGEKLMAAGRKGNVTALIHLFKALVWNDQNQTQRPATDLETPEDQNNAPLPSARKMAQILRIPQKSSRKS